MVNLSTVRCTGPLEGHFEALGQELLALGYTPLSAKNVLRVAAHLSRWLESHQLFLEDLTPELIVAFFRARRRAGYTQFLTPHALDPALRYLESTGTVTRSMPNSAPISSLERLLCDYTYHLQTERALTPGVVRGYRDCARCFLEARFGSDSSRFDALSPQDVLHFVLDQSRRHSAGTSKLQATALRSFLRYLYLNDVITTDLGSVVPSVAHWRSSGLPKGLEEVEVQRLLRICDRRTQLGRRNYALLLLMLRLGLRRCEVAALTLDDVDWRHGEITVRGKGREEPLPLPPDVGEALTRYLQAFQPHLLDQRHIFPRIRAPRGPLSSAGIGTIVCKLLRRAGIHPPHTHRLRHTAASQMLRRGASLDQIAQVLRHRSHDTTAIYAKVDHQALRAVAQPWPGGAS